MSFGFAHPWALLLLLGLPAYALWCRRWPRRAFVFSRTGSLARIGKGRADFLVRLPGRLRAGAVVLLVIALAGPRTGLTSVDVETEGIAITVVIDISSSMLAEDFHPENRLSVAKKKVAEFIRGRRYDRIGMVAFAGEALTQVPITIDYPVLYRALENLRIGDLEDGTAIGTAIATAANRLRDVPGPSRVMILMTDGENNRGEIDPLTAARAAAAFGIKIYTIGVGSDGVAPVPVACGIFGGCQYASLQVHVDEELLRQIAELTGGQYFRATNAAALDSIYRQIDALEKTPLRVRRYVEYTPHYLPFLLAAACLLVGEWLLRASRWGRVP
jgi:Ca-activated chloride channel family protein